MEWSTPQQSIFCGVELEAKVENMSVLLLTATVDSGYFGNVETKISDTAIRKRQYEETLEKYITMSEFTSFVFAENSGTPIDEERFKKLCHKHGKEIEFLFLPGNVKKKYGKSFGESQLIEDAFDRSALISNSDLFYKVTGRVWIENINKLIANDEKSHFIAYNHRKWVTTIFFCITKKDYLRYIKGNRGDYDRDSSESIKVGGDSNRENLF